LEKVRREAGAMHAAANGPDEEETVAPRGETNSPAASPHRSAPPPLVPRQDSPNWSEQIHALRQELSSLKQDLAAARAEFETTAEALRRELQELNQQLGN